MYCFRCGKKLPGREIYCPDCDTPKKKRSRRNRRMILGLFIFLSGAIAGSFFDSYVFKGEAWKHNFFSGLCDEGENNAKQNSNALTSSPALPEITENNGSAITLFSERENISTPEVDGSITQEPVSDSNYEADSNIIVASDDLPKAEQVLNEAYEEAYANKTSEATEDGVNNENVSDPQPESDTGVLVPAEAAIESETPKEDNVEETAGEVVQIVEQTSDGATVVEEPVVETPAPENTEPQKALVYKDVKILENLDNTDSYHGFATSDCAELLFASNRIQVNGKPTFQCFAKDLMKNSEAERLFEWNGNIWTPEITPDKNWVIFSSDSVKPEHIFLYDMNTKHSMNLTSGNSKNMMPSISPDGTTAAFVSNRAGKYHIWTVNLFNRSKLVQITKGNVNDREPRWSPDGKSIIFTRIIENMKVSHIMSVAADGSSEPKELVSGNSRNWIADISPDGSLLAFTRSMKANGSNNTIVLLDMNTGKEQVLTFPGIYESFRPVWFADNSGFVFHVNKKSGKCLYKANFVRE